MKRIIVLFLVIALLLPSNLIAFAAENETSDTDTVYVRLNDLGYTQKGSGWQPSSLQDDLKRTTNLTSKPDASCEWRPTLAKGYYEVYVWKLVHANSATQVKFEIFSADGGGTKTLNYTEGESGWAKLGTYLFEEGTGGYVVASGSGGYMRSGPVKFVKTVEPGTEDYSSVFSDTSGSPYKASIEFLARLGITDVTSGTFRPTEEITYDEFMFFIGCCMGEAAAVKTTGEAVITYNQALKEILCMLGYDIIAEKNGGYPQGYIVTANRLNITKRTVRSADAVITRETAAQLIYNALDVALLEAVTFGEYIEFEAVEGVTVLEKYMDIYKIEGRVTANYFTTLIGSSSLDSGKVQIGNDIYLVGDTDVDKYIGQKVTIWAKGDERTDEEKTILYIEPKTRDREIIEVSFDDILPETTISNFCYYSNNKRKSVSIESNPVLIYNGKAKIDYTASDFKPEYGDVTLIDSNSNGKFDVIISNNYKTLIVADVDNYLKKLHFKNETEAEWKSISFDDDKKKIEFLNSDGTEVSFKDINEFDVISVLKSVDGEVLKAIRSDAKVRGKIDTLAENEAVIYNKTYHIADSILSDPTAVQPNLTDMAAFYLDFKSTIVLIDNEDGAGKQYGFLYAAGDFGILKEKVQVKIFTENDEWIVFDLADKIIFNGNRIKQEDIFKSELLFDNSQNIKRQMVSYCLDENNKIELLNCVDTNEAAAPENVKLSKLTLNYETESSVTVRGKLISARYVFDDKTRIFMLPDDLNDEDGYSSLLYSDMDENKLNKLKVYDVDENMCPAAITTDYTVTTTYTSGSPVGVVTSVDYARNEDDEFVQRISMLVGGKPTEVFASESVSQAIFAATALSDPEKDSAATNNALPERISFNKLQVGDVIQYIADRENEIKTARVLYRINSPLNCEHNGSTMSSFEEDSTYAAVYYASGTVSKTIGSGVVMNLLKASNTDEEYIRTHLLGSAAKVVMYLSETEEVVPATIQDLVIGDKIFIYKKMGVSTFLLIYK